ncbi:BrnT family toxin [Nitrosomonas sp.]|uniref:BrnT family toxin n=1 Tax=Nitrosomonas sp. TaxID=42353 RepID=UPI0026314121|nr:BrnT family toxin [Nitrosomonas sp.]
MTITYDPEKRAQALAESGLDFEDAKYLLEGIILEVEDIRDYGETRIICYGLLEGRMVVVGYTPRGADRHIFSMRKANEREQTRIGPEIGL